MQATTKDQSTGKTFLIKVRKEWFETTSEFRAAYGLAADGSDDLGDLSGNGISNIFYHLFGMGDPSAPSQQTERVSNSLAIPGMPRIVSNSDQTTSFFYTTRVSLETYWIQPQLSTDLTNWHYYQAPWIDTNPEFQITGYSEMPVGEHHKVIELRFYTAPEINDPDTPDYPNLFFKIKADRS